MRRRRRRTNGSSGWRARRWGVRGAGRPRPAGGAAGAPGARPAPPAGYSAITDARYYLNHAKIPTVILGPGSMTVAHTADEWVTVDELATAARAYARLFVGFLGVRGTVGPTRAA